MTGKRAKGLVVLFWVGIVLGAGPAALAQETVQPSQYGLDACVQRALEANPELDEARYDLRSAEWKHTQARLGRTPRLEMMNVMGVVEDAEGDAITGHTIDGELGYFNKMDVKFTLPLFTFGKLTNKIRAAGENVKTKEAKETKTKSELILKVHKLYYGLVLTRQLLEATKDVQNGFTEAHDIAEERLEKEDPSVTEADLLQLRVGLAGITKGVRKLEREVIMTEEALRQTIGIGSQQPFDIADQILNPVDYELKPLDYYLTRLESNNPDMRRLKAGLAAEEANYRAEVADYYPTLLAVGGLHYAEAPGRAEQDNPYLKDQFNYFNVGGALAVRWKLNFFQTHAEVQEKKMRFLRMKSRYESGQQGLVLSIKEQYHRVKEKYDSLDSSFEGRKAGRALLLLSLANFKFGIGTGKDVFNALSIYAKTAADYFESVFDYNMAVAELKAAIGDDLVMAQAPVAEQKTE